VGEGGLRDQGQGAQRIPNPHANQSTRETNPPTHLPQLELVVEETVALKERQETPDSPEALTCIPSLSLADIPKKASKVGWEGWGGGGERGLKVGGGRVLRVVTAVCCDLNCEVLLLKAIR